MILPKKENETTIRTKRSGQVKITGLFPSLEEGPGESNFRPDQKQMQPFALDLRCDVCNQRNEVFAGRLVHSKNNNPAFINIKCPTILSRDIEIILPDKRRKAFHLEGIMPEEELNEFIEELKESEGAEKARIINEVRCKEPYIVELILHPLPFKKLKKYKIPMGWHTTCFNCSNLVDFQFGFNIDEQLQLAAEREVLSQKKDLTEKEVKGVILRQIQADTRETTLIVCAINLCKYVRDWWIKDGILKLTRRQRLGRWIYGS